MKYWNKDKEVRRKHWTKVVMPQQSRLVPTVHGWVQRITGASTDEMKRWCQLNPSTGRFYFYYGTNSWWFENAADATMFTLRWACVTT